MRKIGPQRARCDRPHNTLRPDEPRAGLNADRLGTTLTVVQDPTNYLAVPYVPRASATNVFSTLVDGGIGSGTISVSFNNSVQAQEIAAFEYTCRVPGPAPADAPALATLTQRRAHF